MRCVVGMIAKMDSNRPDQGTEDGEHYSIDEGTLG
jgi:hypothetical protein